MNLSRKNSRLKFKPPFPWFGGESRVAELVWTRFVALDNYVEPFFGSGAVLMNSPYIPRHETINDLDCYVANFWRATSLDPAGVAEHCDWPINETDCHARHLWLVHQADFRERMRTDPDYYDAKIAGWWVWGQCLWIAGGWCDSAKYDSGKPNQSRVALCRGRGVHRPKQQLREYFAQLRNRLRQVRVCCGDWSRICGTVPTTRLGITGRSEERRVGKEGRSRWSPYH